MRRFKTAVQGAVAREPVIIVQSVVAGLEVIQATVTAMPTWAHGVLAATLVGLGTYISRSQVTPIANPSQAS